MNPNDLKQILDALTQADVREFELKTGSFDLSLKRGPQAFPAAPGPLPVGFASPLPLPAMPAPAQAALTPQTALTPGAAAPAAAPVPAAPAPDAAAPASAPAKPAESAPGTPAAAHPPHKGTPVKAPIVGTFYAASSPDAAPYVKVGDSVQAGQVLCIIEAMKLMNEIEAETAGTIREILVKNAEPVEYGQTLFIIE